MNPLEVVVERFFALLAGAAGLLFLVLIVAIVALFYLQWKQNQKTNKIIGDFGKKLTDLEKKLEDRIKVASGEEEIKKLRQEFEKLEKDADSDFRALKKWLDDKLEGMRTRYENYVGQIEKLTRNIEEARNAVAQGVGQLVAVLVAALQGGRGALMQVLEKIGAGQKKEDNGSGQPSSSGPVADLPPPAKKE